MMLSTLGHLLEWSFTYLCTKFGTLPSTVTEWATIIFHVPSLLVDK